MEFKKFLDQVLFREIVSALKVTWNHMFVREVTSQYPHEKLRLPDTHRGALCLLYYNEQEKKTKKEERCVGCDLCEVACPSHCIKVVSGERQEAGVVRRIATEFYIDMTKCVFCGFCVEACPVNALGMTKMYEYSTENKRTLIFDKTRLYDIGETCYADAKAYLVAHNQEVAGEVGEAYRYRFPPHFDPNKIEPPKPKSVPVPKAAPAVLT